MKLENDSPTSGYLFKSLIIHDQKISIHSPLSPSKEFEALVFNHGITPCNRTSSLHESWWNEGLQTLGREAGNRHRSITRYALLLNLFVESY